MDIERYPMRILLSLLLVAIAIAPSALAGEGSCSSCPLSGYECENECPLAHAANRHRATGTEALAVSEVLRADEIARVVRNLRRI
jgi:hypothetical protein